MALPLPAQDAELVILARRGREDAFGALYERYFPGVHDFLTRLLRDRQEAADVTQDTFIKAFERLGHLEKPESFKSWLFTIAHRNGLNRIERSKRAVSVGDFYLSDREAASLGVIDPDRAGDPERSAEARAAARLIWEAAAGLDPRTYAVMDLHVRQGLGSAEIAEVLGVSKGNAYTMVSRMKKSFSQTLSTYLLVSKGSADCTELAAIVSGGHGSGLTPELRKVVDRHARSCEICEENRKVLFLPIKMFAALAAAPIPAGLQATIWGGVETAAAASIGAGVATGAGAAATGAGAVTTQAVVASASPAAVAAKAGVLAWVKVNYAAAIGAAALVAAVASGSAVLLNNADEGDAQVLSAGVAVLPEAPASDITPTGETTPGAPTTVVAASTGSPVTPPLPPIPVTSAPPSTTPSSSTTLVPPPPLILSADSARLDEDSSIVIDVLGNDSGYAPGAAPAVAVAPTHGTARASGSSVWYAPSRDFVGSDTFDYSIEGIDGTTRSARVVVTVDPINDAPNVPGPGTISTREDTSISFDPLQGAVDVDGDSLEVVRYDRTSDEGGSVVSGSLVYTPPANWFGTDQFTYVVGDGSVEVTVLVTIVVSAVNDPPVGPTPTMAAVEDTVANGNLLAGWSDVEGDRVFVADPGSRTTAAGGKAEVGASGAATYNPPDDFSGRDTFAVTISDGTASISVVVLIDVTAINDPPEVITESVTVAEDAQVGSAVGILIAEDPDGDDVYFESVSITPFDVLADGTLILRQRLDYEDETRYRLDAMAIDEQGAVTDFFIWLFVTDVDEAPGVVGGTFDVDGGDPAGTVVGTVTATDPEGGTIVFSLRGGSGVLTINPGTGAVSVVGVVDPAVFPVTAIAVATDPGGNQGTATITVVVDDIDGFDSEVWSRY